MNNGSYIFGVLILTLIAAACQSTDKKVDVFENPAGVHSRYPHLFTTQDSLYMSWIKTENGVSSLNFATYSKGNWSNHRTIAKDSSWFINWADFPSIIANKNGPVAAHWLNKKPGGTYAYDVNISLSDSDGTWSPVLVPHSDSTATEHGFVSMIPWDNNTILAVWLDGRQSAGRTEKQYFDLDYAMTLRSALISTSGKIEQQFLIDDSVCDCCQTSLVKTPDGAVVAYRNRTDNEIRDIYISRFNGQTWSAGSAVFNDGWKIGACPVNGPSLAADDSLVAISWPTGAENNSGVKASISSDGGQSFSKPVTLNHNKALGRVDIALHDNKVYISWLEDADKKAALNLRALDAQQNLSNTITADTINGSRQTGFPQLEIINNELILAWTVVKDSLTEVQTIRKELPLF